LDPRCRADEHPDSITPARAGAREVIVKNIILTHWRTSLCGALLIIGALYGLAHGWLDVDQATPWIVAGLGLLASPDASSVDLQALVRQTLEARASAAPPSPFVPAPPSAGTPSKEDPHP
jgi:hypothetical protein